MKAQNPNHDATRELPSDCELLTAAAGGGVGWGTLWVPAGRGLGQRSLSSAGKRKNQVANQNVL